MMMLIMAETEKDLKSMLNSLQSWCECWPWPRFHTDQINVHIHTPVSIQSKCTQS